MLKCVIKLARNLIMNDPQNTLMDELVLEQYQNLIEQEEFCQLPKVALFRWAKASKNLDPNKARFLLDKMQHLFGTEALDLMDILTIEPSDANSNVNTFSGPICKNVFDSGSIINYDYLHDIDQLKQKQEELIKSNQKLSDEITTKNNQIKELTMQISQAKEELIQADNHVNFLNLEKNSLKIELEEVKRIAKETKSEMTDLQNEHKNLLNTHQKLQLFHHKLEESLRNNKESLIQTKELLDLINQGDAKMLDTSNYLLPFPLSTVYGIPFKSSLFEGILYKFSLLKNSRVDDYVIVTASSSYNSYPSNVLVNDNSLWCSWHDGQTVLKPNEWIQFDFKSKKMAISAYAFKVNCSPKSWKIEGSNDNTSFTIIHNQALNDDFKECSGGKEKLYTLEKVSDMFRYIRITQGDDGNWNYFDQPVYKHLFSIFRIELFGYYQK